ncbi:hypothetical protein SPHINGOT1_120399 [Sphingomonas sp. T1]|nr:hypothetical protein SPHINGOT1_120399 [Sphingomonas sp. T1]
MILKQDRPLHGVAEPGDPGIFALRHQRAERRRPAVIFDHLEAVQPVLDTRAAHHDHRPVPFARRIDPLARACRVGQVLRRDQIVERAERPVAVATHLRIGMPRIVEQLIFQPQRLALALQQAGIDEILDPAVRAGRQLEIDRKLEIAIFAGRDEVAAAAVHAQHAAGHRPARRRKRRPLRAAPAGTCLAVPQQFPAFALLLSRQPIAQPALLRQRGRGHRVARRRIGDDADVAEPYLGVPRSVRVGDRMDLECDEAARVDIVDGIGRGHAVDPAAQPRADRLDTVVVPVARAEGLPRGRVAAERVQPLPALFVVHARAPRPCRRIYLDLIAVHDAIAIIGSALSADHHPRIERRVGLRVELDDEVAILGLGHEPAIGLAGLGAPDQLAILERVGRVAAGRSPAGQPRARRHVAPWRFCLICGGLRRRGRIDRRLQQQRCGRQGQNCECSNHSPPLFSFLRARAEQPYPDRSGRLASFHRRHVAAVRLSKTNPNLWSGHMQTDCKAFYQCFRRFGAYRT